MGMDWGFHNQANLGVETQEHKGGQKVFKTGVLTASRDIGYPWNEVGTVRVVKNNSSAG